MPRTPKQNRTHPQIEKEALLSLIPTAIYIKYYEYEYEDMFI